MGAVLNKKSEQGKRVVGSSFLNNRNSTTLDHRYWTAFYTSPRHEKSAAERLEADGFEVYCPVSENLRVWSDRKKKVKEPLFKSYLFCKVNEKERIAILQDHSIKFNVYWLGKPALIRDEEIDAIKRFLNEYPEARSEFPSLKRGTSLVIKEGPFENQEAIVTEVRGGKVRLELKRIHFFLEAPIGKFAIELKNLND